MVRFLIKHVNTFGVESDAELFVFLGNEEDADLWLRHVCRVRSLPPGKLDGQTNCIEQRVAPMRESEKGLIRPSSARRSSASFESRSKE